MDGIFGISFRVLGIMFVLFTLGRSLNVFYLYREDRGTDSAFDSVLTIISALLMLAGFPIFGVYYLFAQFDTERAKRRENKKMWELHEKMIDGECRKSYNEGYEKGYRDGFQSGLSTKKSDINHDKKECSL